MCCPLLHQGSRTGHIIRAKHDVLRRLNDRTTTGWFQDVVRGHHQHPSLNLSLDAERQVNGHLIAVEVRVERDTNQRMQLNGFALSEDGFKGLQPETMERRCPVEHHRMLLDDFVQDVPNFVYGVLHHLFGRFDGVHKAALLKLVVDKRLEQLKRHLLGDTTLMQTKIGTDHDDRTPGIVHSLTQQVLAEPTILALEHVAQ
jgi:hypothetical protein